MISPENLNIYRPYCRDHARVVKQGDLNSVLHLAVLMMEIVILYLVVV